MAFDGFQSQLGGFGDDPAFRGVQGWEPSTQGISGLGGQSVRNAALTTQMAGAGLEGLGQIAAAKDTANKYREMQARQKSKGIFGGLADLASFGLSFVPGIGTAAKIGIGLATQAGKSFL